MAQTILGSKGCLNADLIIAQSQGFSITIEHFNENGLPIDHTGDVGYCRLRRDGSDDVVLDSYITCGVKVVFEVPGNVTKTIAAGEWDWDMFVNDVRLLYGKANVYDTISRDVIDG